MPVLLGAAADSVDPRLAIKEALSSQFPSITIVDVQRSPVANLYEVFTGNQIFYSDETGAYLLEGALIDAQSKRNVTVERLDERNSIHFQALPFQLAIKTIHGDGSRRLAVFSDPDCSHCQKLEKELQSVPNVTVYTFLLPVASTHPNAAAHARAIWCSADRSQAWVQWMLNQKDPDSRPCEGDPIQSLHALAIEFHVTGTPTLYFQDGKRVSHEISADEMGRMLAASTATQQIQSAAPPCDADQQPSASSCRFTATP